MPSPTAIRTVAALVCAALILAFGLPVVSPAASSPGTDPLPTRTQRLNGTWIPDVDATIARLAEGRTYPMEPYELEDLREMIAATGLSVDIPGMRATEKGPGGAEVGFTLESVQESGETVVLAGEHRRYTIRFQRDGSIVVGQGIIMRRAE